MGYGFCQIIKDCILTSVGWLHAASRNDANHAPTAIRFGMEWPGRQGADTTVTESLSKQVSSDKIYLIDYASENESTTQVTRDFALKTGTLRFELSAALVLKVILFVALWFVIFRFNGKKAAPQPDIAEQFQLPAASESTITPVKP